VVKKRWCWAIIAFFWGVAWANAMDTPNMPFQEEGWRWRQSPRISIVNEGRIERFDFSALHKDLSEKVAALTSNLPAQNKDKNICMGGFSLIYKSKGGTLQKTDYMPLSYVPLSNVWLEIAFSSGYSIFNNGPNGRPMPVDSLNYNDTTQNFANPRGSWRQGRVPLFALKRVLMEPGPDHSPFCPEKREKNMRYHSSVLRTTLGIKSNKLENFLYNYVGPYTSSTHPLSIENSFVAQSTNKILDRLEQLKNKGPSAFDKEWVYPNLKEWDASLQRWDASFIDSEQNMLLYAKFTIRSHLAYLREREEGLQNAIAADKDNIKALIFHICSQRDMCELCALTLFRESEIFFKRQKIYDEGNQLTDEGGGVLADSHLWSAVCQGLGGRMPKKMKLLFMTSSNQSYFKNFKLSRHLFTGLDALSLQTGQEAVSLDTYLPFCVQIAKKRQHYSHLLEPHI